MKLKDILKIIDFGNLILICYIEDDDDIPLWEGTGFDLPWWVGELYLSKSEFLARPIDFRSSLGEEYDNKPGFVISLNEEKPE